MAAGRHSRTFYFSEMKFKFVITAVTCSNVGSYQNVTELYTALVPPCADLLVHWVRAMCVGCALRFVRSHHGAHLETLHFLSSRYALAFDDSNL